MSADTAPYEPNMDALTIAHDIEQTRLRCEDARVWVVSEHRLMCNATNRREKNRHRMLWEQALETVRAERAEHARLVAALVGMTERNER